MSLLTLVGCFVAKNPVDDAERKWLAQGIASYRIQVMRVQSIWHAQSQTITVRGGKVADHKASCTPAPAEGGKCAVRPYRPEDYTVPGLFAAARDQAKLGGGKWSKITFDPAYGFPSRISYNHPDVVDEDQGWVVQSFEVLK